MNTRPLTREEFRDALHKGLGRAVQHVRSANPSEVRDELLYACLHNVAHDPQLESSRAPWLVKMIQLSGEVNFYRREIFKSYFNTPDGRFATWDNLQLFQIMCQFAIHGDTEAREEMYRVFDWQFTREEFTGWPYAVDEILETDGVSGLIFIVDRMGCCIRDEQYVYLSPHYVQKAEELLGAEVVRKTLREEAKRNEFVRIFLEHPKTQKDAEDEPQRETKEQRRERILAEYSLPYMVDSFLKDDFSRYKDNERFVDDPYGFLRSVQKFSVVGEFANEEDLHYALDKIISTDDPLRQVTLLRTFYQRPLPRMDEKLLDMLDSENENLAWAVGIVLSDESHPAIREKGLEILKADPPKKNWFEAITGAQGSFQREDVELLENSLLTKTIPHEYDLESAGIGLRHIYKRFPGEHFKTIYLWLYEHGPCSFCREEIVETLLENHWATPELIEECRDDASEEIRELVAALETG